MSHVGESLIKLVVKDVCHSHVQYGLLLQKLGEALNHAVHHSFCKYTHVACIIHVCCENRGRTCTRNGMHGQEDFGMGVQLPYTSFMATCVFENM